jgi:hypothetical protein
LAASAANPSIVFSDRPHLDDLPIALRAPVRTGSAIPEIRLQHECLTAHLIG